MFKLKALYQWSLRDHGLLVIRLKLRRKIREPYADAELLSVKLMKPILNE